ncbi:CG33679, partial [Drosophila busckii]
MLRIAFLGALALSLCAAYTRHTNIKCEVLNKTMGEIPVCKLKVLGRGKIGANVQVKMYNPPAYNITLNFSIWRKLNGYHPFLFNITVDFCHYMKHPNPMQVFYYFHRAFMPYSNMNHTCPYDHDVIINNFVLADDMFDKVPVPKGSYMFNLRISANSIWAAQINAYLDIDVR